MPHLMLYSGSFSVCAHVPLTGAVQNCVSKYAYMMFALRDQQMFLHVFSKPLLTCVKLTGTFRVMSLVEFHKSVKNVLSLFDFLSSALCYKVCLLCYKF